MARKRNGGGLWWSSQLAPGLAKSTALGVAQRIDNPSGPYSRSDCQPQQG